jgi:hypothetical protein
MCYDQRMKIDAKKPAKRVAKGFTIGRAGFAKISAVEGISLTPAMAADLRVFEQRGLSPDERRNGIIKKYGKTHAQIQCMMP